MATRREGGKECRRLRVEDPGGQVNRACIWPEDDYDEAREVCVQNPSSDPAFLAAYEVLGRLGRGGMGEVLHLRHRVWDLELAAKIPLPAMVESAGGLEQFRGEAETWIALPLHPNVVACHYVRVFDGIPVIFAEYVAGTSLAELRRGAWKEGLLERLDIGLPVALQAAYGLWHAHQAGVIHQDIKPSNILAGPDGARLTDFGIAAVGAFRKSGDSPLVSGSETIMATVVGLTPHYASPEQLGSEEARAVARTRLRGGSERRGNATPDPEPAANSPRASRRGRGGPEGARPATPSVRAESSEKLTFVGSEVARGTAVPGQTTSVRSTQAGVDRGQCDGPGSERTITRATDIWSLGCTFLEIWTGGNEWLPGEAHRLLEKVRGLPPDLRDLLEGMLRVDPDARPDIKAVVERLEQAMRQRNLPVVRPQAAPFRADGLNNRAASAMEMGAVGQAQGLLKEALTVDPHHPEALFNAALLAWRMGEITDMAALGRVRALNGGVAALAEAWIQIERGDEVGAWAALDRLAEVGAGEVRTTRAVARASRQVRNRIREIALIQAHSKTIDSLATDGTTAVSGSRDGTLRIWDLRKRAALLSIPAHDRQEQTLLIRGVVQSPDRRRIYCVGWDGHIRGFEAKTGRPLFVFDQPGKLFCLCLSDDGRRLFTGSGSGSLWCWRLEGDTAIFETEWLMLPNDFSVLDVLWHEGRLYVASEDGWVRILEEGFVVAQFRPETGPECLRIEPHSGRLLVGERGKRISVYEGETRVFTLEGMLSSVGAMAVHPDRPLLACASGFAWYVWDLQKQRCERTVEVKALVRDLDFLPDGDLLLVDWNGGMRRVRVEEGTEAPSLLAVPRLSGELGQEKRAMEEQIQQAEVELAAGKVSEALQIARKVRENTTYAREERVLRLWEGLAARRSVTTPRTVWEYAQKTGIKASARILFCGDLLATADEVGRVSLTSLHDLSVRWQHRFPEGDLSARSLAYVPATRRLAIGCYRAWYSVSIDSFEMERHEVPTSSITTLTAGPDGRVVAADDMGHLHHTPDEVVRSPNNFIYGMIFLEDGSLLTADDQGALLRFRLGAGRGMAPGEWSSGRTAASPPESLVGQMGTPGASFLCLKKGPGGPWAGREDGTVVGPSGRGWQAHTMGVADLDFLDDGHMLTASFDRTVKIWELSSGRCIYTLDGFTHPLWGVAALSRNRFWTAADDGVARGWYLDWDLG